jgi:hypothetical protein
MIDNPDIFKQNSYYRSAAVIYALRFALTPNPQFRYFAFHGDGGGDCSNFISQCLRAGGAPMIYNSPRPWWYDNSSPNLNKHSWSLSWSVANSLNLCLKSRGKSMLPGLKGFEVYDTEMLDFGDIIQYENQNGEIYHSAIITAFTNERGSKFPLITQHTFDARNISYIKPKASKTHLMKIVIT